MMKSIVEEKLVKGSVMLWQELSGCGGIYRKDFPIPWYTLYCDQ